MRRTGSVGLLDIGSTNFRYALGRPAEGRLTDVRAEATRPHALESQLVAAVDELRDVAGESLDAVAIASTGLVDGTAVREFDTPDGATIERIDVGAAVEGSCGLRTYLENDCTAAALGEWHFGPEPAHDCLVHVTVGTGIGGGVVDRGRVLRGETGQAGEFGLLPIAADVEDEDRAVAWEEFCSGRGIARYARRHLARADDASALRSVDAITAEDVFRLAAGGDEFARSLLDRIARYNAAGVGAIANAFNPGLVTFGGSVALNNAEWLLDGIERHLHRYCFVDPPALRITELGDEIGLYGALAVYRERASERKAGR